MDCPRGHSHKFEELMEQAPGTPEQAWCGRWFQCPAGCGYTVLIPSAELELKFVRAFEKAGEL